MKQNQNTKCWKCYECEHFYECDRNFNGDCWCDYYDTYIRENFDVRENYTNRGNNTDVE